jgi:hypothetical protein
VVRWLEQEGHSKRRIFGSAGHWRNATRKGAEEDEGDIGAADFTTFSANIRAISYSK